MIRFAAMLVVRLAAAALPAPLRGWGRAMAAETAAIARPFTALLFALGCLGGALREALRFHLPDPAQGGASAPPGPEHPVMSSSKRLLDRPRHLAAACAAGATGLGLVYLAAAGAPSRYLMINGTALALGLLVVAALASTPRPSGAWRGLAGLALAGALLLVALLGVSADGATRWISIGGVLLQPGLFLLPVLALAFARSANGLCLLAVLTAALAVALQPDRAMAGALAAGMAALVLARPSRLAAAALGIAAAAFAVTLIRADASAAVPYVDQLFFSSFAVHPLAGAAVVGGAALMLVPALVGLVRDPRNRAAYAVFGAIWLGVILAAALGNYPTPLVGYGGSAILGYALSLAGLPSRAGASLAADRAPDPAEGEAEPGPRLYAGLPASA